MRKILFPIIIFFLFIFSIPKADAATCAVGQSPCQSSYTYNEADQKCHGFVSQSNVQGAPLIPDTKDPQCTPATADSPAPTPTPGCENVQGNVAVGSRCVPTGEQDACPGGNKARGQRGEPYCVYPPPPTPSPNRSTLFYDPSNQYSNPNYVVADKCLACNPPDRWNEVKEVCETTTYPPQEKSPTEYVCRGNEYCLPGAGCKVIPTPIPAPNPTPINANFNPCPTPPAGPGWNESTGNCDQVLTGLGITLGTSAQGIGKGLLGILITLGGAISFIIIIITGYRLMTSQGDPEKIKAAREQLTSAIVGLLFIIFSVSILSFLGFNVLRIPGFGN